MITPRERGQVLFGETHRIMTGCGKAYVTINHDDQGLAEVFMTLGKAGGCSAAQTEAVCRMVSLALRSGVDATAIVKHLKDIRCPSQVLLEERVLSCADGIAKVLAEAIKEASQGG